MAENVCLMLTEANSSNDKALITALSLAATSANLGKRTILYVAEKWIKLARAGEIENRDRVLWDYKGTPLVELFRQFQDGGGQLWVSAFYADESYLSKHPLIQGAYAVDDPTLMTFLLQDTLVLNF